MIVCPVCSHHNPEHLRACQSCGAALDKFVYRACPACGALNAAEALFCHRCLAKLSSTADTPELPEEETPSAGEVEAGPAERPAETLIASLLTEPDAPVRADPARQQETLEPKAPSVEHMVTQATDAPGAIAQITPSGESPETSITGPIKGKTQDDRPSHDTRVPRRVSSRAAQETVLDIPSPLEGVQDVIPLETVVALPHRAEALTGHTPGETQRRDAALFQRIATEPASLYEQAQRVLPRPAADTSQVGRKLLYLLVLLSAVVPLFTGGMLVTWVQPRPSITALAGTLGALPAGARVLLSFDYDPAYAGELDPLAVAVTRQLVGRSVQVVAMSTRPGGMGLAERVLAQATANKPAYSYGQQYALLGYLPDRQAGLRLLTESLQAAFPGDYVQKQALSELPVTRALGGVEDFEHIIVFSDDSQIVRHWVEQVQSRTGASLHALVTVRVAPVLTPYLQSAQLTSLIGAAGGAAEFEVAAGLPGSGLRGVDGYLALLMTMLLVVIVTNAVYIGRGRRPNHRS